MGGTVISLKIENYKMLNLNLVYMMERNNITKKWKNSGNIWEICGWYMIFQRYNFEKFRGAIISPQIEKSKIEKKRIYLYPKNTYNNQKWNNSEHI